jgi:hypothetical protein
MEVVDLREQRKYGLVLEGESLLHHHDEGVQVAVHDEGVVHVLALSGLQQDEELDDEAGGEDERALCGEVRVVRAQIVRELDHESDHVADYGYLDDFSDSLLGRVLCIRVDNLVLNF